MRRLLPALVLVLLAGCRAYELPAPPGLDAGEPLSVNGRDGWVKKQLSFGAFKVRDIQRGWTRGKSWELAGFKSSKTAQPFHFELAHDDVSVWNAECAFTTRDQGVGLVDGWELGLESKASLQCALTAAAGDDSAAAPLRLELHADDDRPLAGRLTGTHELDVQGVGLAAFTNGERGPTGGFYLREAGRPIAMVMVVNGGKVRFARDVTPASRDLAATVAAALLLIDQRTRGQ